MSTPTPTPTPLNYAPRPPAHQRRIFRRVMLVTVLLAFITSGWWCGPSAWRRVQLLYWQHKCMVYTPQTDKAVFEVGSATNLVPGEWSAFYTLVSPPGFRSSATLFLHELKKPNGESRLVVVDIEPGGAGPGDPGFYCVGRVFSPGSLSHPPVELKDRFGEWTGNDYEPFKVFGGTVDASDPTHFTIRREAAGKTTFFDGWLQNDDTVSFGERKSASPAN